MEIRRGKRNLLLNSSFEVDSNSDGTPDSWVKGTPSGTNTLSLVGSDVISGAKALRVQVAGLTTANHAAYVLQAITTLPPVGTPIELSGFAHIVSLTRAVFYMQLQWRDAANAVVGTTATYELAAGNSAPEYCTVRSAVPATAAKVNIIFGVRALEADASGEAVVDLHYCGTRRRTISL